MQLCNAIPGRNLPVLNFAYHVSSQTVNLPVCPYMVHNPAVIRETLFLKLLTKLFVCFFGVVDTIVGSLVVCGVVLFHIFLIFCITSFSPGGYVLITG